VISKRFTQPMVVAGLWFCLMAMTFLSCSSSLLAQDDSERNPSHADRDREIGSASIGIGRFTLSPQNAPDLVLDDSGAGTEAGNPLDISTSNTINQQMWSANSTFVNPPGFFNFATLGPFCFTAAGATSGSAVVLDPCPARGGRPGILCGLASSTNSSPPTAQIFALLPAGRPWAALSMWIHAPAPRVNCGR